MAKQKKGFAAMDPEKQKQIASKGGKSLPLEVRREIGRKGGLARAEKLRKDALMLEQRAEGTNDLQVMTQTTETVPIFVQNEKKEAEPISVKSSSVVA